MSDKNDIEKKDKAILIFGILTIKEFLALIILIGTIFINVALGYYQIRDLPEKVNRNAVDISKLKTDFVEIKINQNHFREKQTIMHEDLKEVRRDIKSLLRK